MRFTFERISRIVNELRSYIHSVNVNVLDYKVMESDYKSVNVPSPNDSEWKPFVKGQRWGGKDKHFWFSTNITIPENFNGNKIIFQLNTGKEGQWDATNPQFIIFVNNKLTQGMDTNHTQVMLTQKAVCGEVFKIDLHAYSGMHDSLLELESLISILNPAIEKLYYDIKVPLDICSYMDAEDTRRIDMLTCLNNTINLLDLRIPFSQEFHESVDVALNYLETEFYEKLCGHEDVTAHCVGHTHIDVAWLWTLAQTREKTVRSFSTVLNLMKQYPEYIFMSSQPQLYKYIMEDHPEVYEEIKTRATEGRWEPEGAMWLEADCNLSSGESLVRQVLFGKRFFQKEFGVDSKILWLPDVFGYSAALPQILKKSGVDYFMTTKISWNEYNKIPYDTFNWKGLDGTEILTYFITTGDPNFNLNPHVTTYNGNLVPIALKKGWDRYQQKDINDDILISFGHGDGGGGPTKDMLENAKRLSKGIPGCPKVKIGKSLDFFEKLDEKVSKNKKLPKWVGELYLEYHRGTYTSMARNKKFNRKSEFLFQDAELFNLLGSNVTDKHIYPLQTINDCWETILLNQFHDILPGSSIKEVYEDSKKQYLEIAYKGKELINNAFDSITSQIPACNESNFTVAIFNSLGFVRDDLAEVLLPEEFVNTISECNSDVEITDTTGTKMVSQCIGNKILFYAKDIPSKGYKCFYIKKISAKHQNTSPNTSLVSDDYKSIESNFFDISFDDSFNMVSIFDKLENRQVLQAGKKANALQAFEDKPHNFDAWDINIYYSEKLWEVNDVQSVKLLENGPVKTSLEITRKFLNSTIIQEIHIYSCISKIDVINKIDWKEKQILLKATFPVDIHADKATYEIQYGNVERPTHWNTSWDYARFEVCAHKWADLSEDGYGVSLINDCKYGHDILESTMRLTLLKSATGPNIDADREYHEFTYSLYPHKGDWKTAGTVNMAYALNCPLYSKLVESQEGLLPQDLSFVTVNAENVILEVVKQAEDSKDMIIRLYECYNRRTQVTIDIYKKISSVYECDLMEKNILEMAPSNNSFSFEIKPYEIRTFKVSL